ncbi:hypothetical protein ACV35P_30875, partial [Pseudomonas aeruginosa]
MFFLALLTCGPSFLAQARGFDIKGIGAATFVIFLCGAVGSLVGGFLCDLLIRKGVRRGLAAKGLLTVSGLAAHALADQQVAEEAADQGTDSAAEEDDEGRGADTLDIEAARLRQVART